MKYILTIITILLITTSTNLNGQKSKFSEMDSLLIESKASDDIDVFLYDIHFNMVNDGSKRAKFIGFLLPRDEENRLLKIYRIRTEKLILEGTHNSGNHILNGEYEHFWSNGKIESKEVYANGTKLGERERYTYLGKKRPSKFYSKGRVQLLHDLATT